MSGDSVPAQAPLVVNGWSIYAHPLFLDQLEGLTLAVEARKSRDPKNWRKKNSTKRLAAIFKLLTEALPAVPGAAAFRQGGTPGDPRKHWFRAKYFQQYRLFYRFNSDAKVVLVAWMNDDKTLRAYGSKTDAYATLKGMLEDGNLPYNFDVLLKEAAAADKRFETSLEAAPDR
ncbi:type II toxin-antitoxin system YhaV family toxin [uncultured Sulfitobacter sp.]|uniref:type II toxin-antitoxin system YhaV family toxin n=1 Tax=uncultured Sulfitobacter sp. TaxID=191468 RepID=UPI002587BF2E|nr:type II toxin-antitoxin system YhaV family toxin [uncultured Sulfitobacter sp.]